MPDDYEDVTCLPDVYEGAAGPPVVGRAVAQWPYYLPFGLGVFLVILFCLSFPLQNNWKPGWKTSYVWLTESLQPVLEQRKGFLKGTGFESTESEGIAPDKIADPITLLTTHASVMTWWVMTLAYVLACLVALVVSARAIRESLGGTAWERRARLAALIAFGGLCGAAFSWLQSRFGRFNCDDSGFFSQLMCVGGAATGDYAYVPQYHLRLDALGICLIVVVAAAATAVLLPLARGRGGRRLGAQRKLLTSVLYCAAAVLITATLRLDATFDWALAQVRPLGKPSEAVQFLFENATGVAASTTTGMGGVYTIFLAAIYLPAAAVFNRRAAEVGGDKLSLSVREQALKLAAVLGPLLAGSVGEVLGRL